MQNPPTSLFYVLDRSNVITDVGGAWDDFATQNEGGSVLRHLVLGTRLLNHVTGDTSRSYVEAVLDATRVLGRQRALPYRCDAPRFKRYMEMQIEPLAADGLRVSHRVLRVEPLARSVRFAALSNTMQERLLVRCTMCNRIRDFNTWHEPDEALDRQLVQGSEPNPVVYGVCPGCREKLSRDV